ncbi:glycoside hydrolase [Pontiellaceae bacterium B1224]|nr:glycoside hydrolase [Pontiellaceae bacterium B1224]
MNYKLISSIYCWSVASLVFGQTVFTVDFSEPAQTIDNIGSSTGMHSDSISRHWKTETVDEIAVLLFDRERGIGLSSFRIQIGAGSDTPEGGIRTPYRRTDCFLRPDGSYDWEREKGVHYWRKKAAEYDVETVIGYLNSPPVCYTENGHGFKTDKTFSSNLKPEHYGDYAAFISKVANHFQTLELPFDSIAPVNEPQWGWHGIPGRAKQEGTPWTNEQIARLVRLMDAEFLANGVKTKILIPEAAEYQALYEELPQRPYAAASDQVHAFWNVSSSNYVGDLQTVEPIVAGHAYFNDGSIERMLHTRQSVAAAVNSSDSKLRFWQSEYCLLGKGWTGGLPVAEVDEMMAALLVARNVHIDFTVANATAWQWWSSTEPRVGRVPPRYYLIETDAKGGETYRATKLLWALGHFSRFVRPGMVRLQVDSDRPEEIGLNSVMASAYMNPAEGGWVMVLINISNEEQAFEIALKDLPTLGKMDSVEGWMTDSTRSMEKISVAGRRLAMPPKSMLTLVVPPE